MNSLVHIFTTLALANLMYLDSIQLAYALLFGVLIDLDHLFSIPGYIRKNGTKIIRGYPWGTPLQKPISYLWVCPLSLILKSYVPVLFFSLHLFLDWLMYDVLRKEFWPVDPEKRSGLKKPELVVEFALTVIAFIIFLYTRKL